MQWDPGASVRSLKQRLMGKVRTVSVWWPRGIDVLGAWLQHKMFILKFL